MKLTDLAKTFIIPAIVLLGILVALIYTISGQSYSSSIILILVTILGSFGLFIESGKGFLRKQFALDYIAMIAIVVSFITHEYYVAALIALMISSGRTLEDYGVRQAKKNLTKLSERIPNTITVLGNSGESIKKSIESVSIGENILVRRGEVIPLDGTLSSKRAQVDESSLTGEPYLVDKEDGDLMRSGTVNMGEVIIISVAKTSSNSTYTKIINLVQKAQIEKAPLVRIANRYSTVFTVITAFICAFAYFYTNSLIGVLAVLVVATPCPLILATPIALLGGMNASAKKRIIIKRLASLEVLSRVTTFIFDKTGTITLGTPVVQKVLVFENKLNKERVAAIAVSLERNSLHPIAKAIVEYGKKKKVAILHATNIRETIGQGLSGTIEGKVYTLEKEAGKEGLVIALLESKKKIAELYFEENIKEDSSKVIRKLKDMNLKLMIFTGDKMSSAEKVVSKLGEHIIVKAECSPEDKLNGIKELKEDKQTIAMVGDGINDAPALALADVGIVFSNEEQTAASEAADVVFIGNNFSLVYDSLLISRKTVQIALQSIFAGIGLSIVCMIFASLGFIPPVIGAFLQEAIDVAVIINALRASRIS